MYGISRATIRATTRRWTASVAVTLSEGGAQRLVHAAAITDAEVASERIEGTVDGWIWSEATLLFQPITGRRFRVQSMTRICRSAWPNPAADQQ